MDVKVWATARLEDGECRVSLHGVGTYEVGERTVTVATSREYEAPNVKAALEDAIKKWKKDIIERTEEATVEARGLARKESEKE